jgi:hypothetical protein
MDFFVIFAAFICLATSVIFFAINVIRFLKIRFMSKVSSVIFNNQEIKNRMMLLILSGCIAAVSVLFMFAVIVFTIWFAPL